MPTGGSQSAADKTLGGLIKDNHRRSSNLLASSRNIKSRDALLNGRLLRAVEIAQQIGPFNHEAAALKRVASVKWLFFAVLLKTRGREAKHTNAAPLDDHGKA